MKISGQFQSISGVNYAIIITNNINDNKVKVIGEDDLFFSNDPLQITINNEDTFNTILKTSATINLITKNYIGDFLFADNSRSIKVNIYKENVPIFCGFVEPATFTQPFASYYDSFSINCVDALSTLENYKYKNITKKEQYDILKVNSTTLSFYDFIQNSILKDLLNLDEKNKTHIYYDKSKGIDNTKLNSILNDIGITESYLLGDDFDDLWNNEELLKEILQYLNLHIIQKGADYYIFDWDSIRLKNTNWFDLIENKDVILPNKSVTIDENNKDIFSSNDGNISIAEVYNCIKIQDEVQKQDTIIESPLDDKSLTSSFKNKQKYMTEFISETKNNNVSKGAEAFLHALKGENFDFDGYKEVDWFFQIVENPNWKCIFGKTTEIKELYETENGEKVNQWKIPYMMAHDSLIPCFIKFGKVEKKANKKDNSVVNSIDMSNYLAISINGNNEKDENARPNANDLRDNAGILRYVGKNSGAVFSPTDDETTNFLIFNGKIMLQPITLESSPYGGNTPAVSQFPLKNDNSKYCGNYDKLKKQNNTAIGIIVSPNGNKFYTRKFYNNKYVNKLPTDNEYLVNDISLQPYYKDEILEDIQFRAVQINGKKEEIDTISKLPILECILKIGDKYCVEVEYNDFSTQKDNTVYAWLTKEEIIKGGKKYLPYYNKTVNLDTLKYEDDDYVMDGWHTGTTTYTHTMSLGINPKIGDKIIGEEFNLQNNIDYTMNLDGEGTAIPIRNSDNLFGQVTFEILGPFNTYFYDRTFYRHRTWFRRKKEKFESIPILPKIQNIFIKDFECKIGTDGGGKIHYGEDKDIIYQSAEVDKYMNIKDDITFKFITQLTSDEAFQMGVSPSVNINSVVNLTNSLPLTKIYNNITKENDKSEKHYINEYWKEYNQPKLLFETSFLNDNKVDFRNIYNYTILGKSFIPINMEFNCKDDSVKLKLKEI